MRESLFFLLLLLGRAGVVAHIQQLDSSNFTAWVLQKPLALVNFGVHWCGFCKTLETELKFVQSELKRQRIDAWLAAVDSTIPENEALAGPQGINGYPSLVLYRNGQRVSDYTGGRSRGELVDYLRRKTGPPAEPINSLEEIEMHLRQMAAPANVESGVTALALGLFPPGSKESGQGAQGRAAQVFLSAASTYDHAKFLIADNLDLVRHFHIDGPTLIVFTGSDGGLTGMVPLNETMDEDNIIYSVLTYSIPLIIRYDQQTQPYLRSLLIKAHVLVFHDDLSLSVELLAAVDEVAPQFRGKLVFIQIASSEHQLMQVFGLQSKDLPELQLADMTDPLQMRRYGLADFLGRRANTKANADADADTDAGKDVSASTITEFLSEYLAGALPRSIFSESAAEVDKVKTKVKLHGRQVEIQNIVSHNFEQRVMADDAVDSLLYVYVPWCAHCKSFEPVIAELALHYSNDPGISFARIDGSKNEVDHPLVRIRGYPSIFLFPAHDKMNPIEYDGERTVSSFVEFISQFRGRGRDDPMYVTHTVDTAGG